MTQILARSIRSYRGRWRTGRRLRSGEGGGGGCGCGQAVDVGVGKETVVGAED